MTEPDDDTQTHPTVPPTDAGARPDPSVPGAPPAPPASSESPPASPPPLRADPNRPADTGWREPPWIPARPRDDRPNLFALLVGLALIAIGVWYFLEHTLGIDLPRIAWGSLWPVLLIVLGGAILIRSLDRRT